MDVKEKAVVAGAGVLAGGIIIGYLLHQCHCPSKGPPTSVVGLAIVLNDSTTKLTTEGGIEVNYTILGATPYGLVDVLAQTHPSPSAPQASVTETTADADGTYSGTISFFAEGITQTFYVYAWDQATGTSSSNAVTVTVLPTSAGLVRPTLTILDPSLTNPGNLDWSATGLTAGGAYEVVSNVPNLLAETGTASASGTASGTILVTNESNTQSTYFVAIRDASTGLTSVDVEFTITLA